MANKMWLAKPFLSITLTNPEKHLECKDENSLAKVRVHRFIFQTALNQKGSTRQCPDLIYSVQWIITIKTKRLNQQINNESIKTYAFIHPLYQPTTRTNHFWKVRIRTSDQWLGPCWSWTSSAVHRMPSQPALNPCALALASDESETLSFWRPAIKKMAHATNIYHFQIYSHMVSWWGILFIKNISKTIWESPMGFQKWRVTGGFISHRANADGHAKFVFKQQGW